MGSMYPSQPYIKRLRRIHREAPTLSQEEVEGALREAFGAALRDLPVELVEDLFDFSIERLRPSLDNGSGSSLVEAFIHTGALIDLFGRVYDADEDPLSDEEWRFVAETVPDYGLEMEMTTLQYVMALVVDRGLL